MASARSTRARKPAAPKTQTLHRGEGKERLFWEITRAGPTITTRFGRFQSEGRRVEKQLADEREAEQVFAAMIADKRKAGYGEPPQKIVPGAASERGVSAQNAELEAVIEASPDDAEGYLVYADWLQQQRDVRGELIVVQHRLSVAPDDGGMIRAEGTLLERFEKELLGPLAECTRGHVWRHGFLRMVVLRRPRGAPIADVLDALLGHPSARFLERLVLDDVIYNEDDVEDVLRILAARAHPTLDSLVMGESYGTAANLEPLWKAMPRLRWLVLAGTSVSTRLGRVDAPALEELVVSHVDRGMLDALSRAIWPKLKRLGVTLSVPTESCDGAITPLLASNALPALEHLTLRRWLSGQTSALIPHDALALELVRFAAKRRLKRLDLHLPLTEAGAHALAAEAGIGAIGSITIWKQALANVALRAQLAERLPNLQWTASAEPTLGDPTTYD